MMISAFYLFESLYIILVSLSKGKGNLFKEEKYPFLIGAVTGAKSVCLYG